MEKIVADAKQKMEQTLAALRQDLTRLRTGRASMSILDGIRVDCYGSQMPLNQVGTLAIPEPRMITITPWDKGVIGSIEKAIQVSDLGLNPANDGKIIRIPLPMLTEERRKELCKLVRKMGEEAKVGVRHVRREANETLKGNAKSQNLSEDEVKRTETEIQKMTDAECAHIDTAVAAKEKEVMTV